ncbi:zinc finger protein [Nitrososphaeria virus YSH_462411]|uniref:Zinc finger protein n=1 Tax=Nitrososphaeria virus YSH_462411 TaxID=3071321 RepID=A0A976UBD1_9CAUD|nr:zinc finger protein [Yangshan Harbor Nitrososphaeria virus]UVF62315.1 zinc finger protein [Nitrososphaeria virus YSH_462411]
MRKTATVTIPNIEKRDKFVMKPRQVIYIRCDYELFKKAVKKSKETGISLNRLTELALEEYLVS